MTDPSLESWVDALIAEFGLDGIDTAALLDLARDAANHVARPAAPITTYVVGLVAGRAGGSPEDVRAAIARVNAMIEA